MGINTGRILNPLKLPPKCMKCVFLCFFIIITIFRLRLIGKGAMFFVDEVRYFNGALGLYDLYCGNVVQGWNYIVYQTQGPIPDPPP